MRRRRMPIMFHNWDEKNLSNTSPLVSTLIFGTEVIFLIDTGASLSMIDEGVVNKIPKLKREVEKSDLDSGEFQAVGGRVTVPTQMVMVNNIVINKSCPLKKNLYIKNLNIANGVYQGILGFDFLAKYSVILDFRNFIGSFREN